MFVFDSNGSVLYYGFEYSDCDGRLLGDIQALKEGDDTSDWDMNGLTRKDMQEAYDEFLEAQGGWKVVADQDGVYPEHMGIAASRVFGYEYLFGLQRLEIQR